MANDIITTDHKLQVAQVLIDNWEVKSYREVAEELDLPIKKVQSIAAYLQSQAKKAGAELPRRGRNADYRIGVQKLLLNSKYYKK